MVHLQADVKKVTQWTEEQNVQWAFTDRNAGSNYTEFFRTLEDLRRVNWDAVASTDFTTPLVKEGKQAEFLVYSFFPWTLVEKIGVISSSIRREVCDALRGMRDLPPVSGERSWYY